MKYAIIGCGRISKNHIPAAKENQLEIVAVCDLLQSRIDKAISQNELPNQVAQYLNYQELLEKEQPDLVAICTESGNHAKIALDCIDAGCHAIIEKPIALSLEDADQIVDHSRKKGVKVSACHQNRFNLSIAKIKQALDDKRFGRLLYATAQIRWNRGKEYYDQAPWRGTWAMDGGALMNQCIHNIDLIRWVMGGEISEVVGFTANLNHNYLETEDLGLAMIRFTNGSYGLIEGTTNIFPKNLEEKLCVFGEKGTVIAGGKAVNQIEEWRFLDQFDNADEMKALYSENPPNVYGYGHKRLYADVLRAIRDDTDPYVTAADGRDALELVLAIYKSSAEGKPVSFPLSSGSTLDQMGRFGR